MNEADYLGSLNEADGSGMGCEQSEHSETEYQYGKVRIPIKDFPRRCGNFAEALADAGVLTLRGTRPR